MKTNFLTGLILILPITLTIVIITWLINLLTSPFQSGIEGVLNYYHVLDKPILFLSAGQVISYVSKIIALVILITFIGIIGFLAQLLVTKTLFSYVNKLLVNIPLFNRIYTKIQDLVSTVFESEGNAFSNVVMVRFPNSDTYTLALVPVEQHRTSTEDLISVFVPGAPNPTFGFMLTCRKEELIYLDMKIEEAIKFVVSCGVMKTDFKLLSR